MYEKVKDSNKKINNSKKSLPQTKQTNPQQNQIIMIIREMERILYWVRHLSQNWDLFSICYIRLVPLKVLKIVLVLPMKIC